MQSYDPNQPQQSSQGGYYQQQPQNQQPRMTLPPASSFFGAQSSSGEYHQIPNTPLSEPPPSPYLTGQYNQQPQSYPATDPSTPYMHSSTISPPNNYNIGPSPHYPAPPQMQQQQQQQMYIPSHSVDQQGYAGMEQQQPQQHIGHPQQQHLQQQQLPPQHHQMQMGYPSTSMMQQQQDHSIQMGYISPINQGIMVNYPSQHQNYSNIQAPPQSHHQVMHQMPTSMMQQQPQQILPPPQHLQQQPQQQHHSHPGQTLQMSNNLRNQHLRQQQHQQPSILPSSSMQGPLPSTPTIESIVPSSSDNNMTQVLQMQKHLSQPQLQQQQHQSSSQKQEKEAAAANNKTSVPQPQQVLNYRMPQQSQSQQPQINQTMDQRRYSGSNVARYSQPHPQQIQQIYQNPISEPINYQHNTPMGPPTMPHRVYHEQQQQQISQEYHQQQMFESQQQQTIISNFPTMNEPSTITATFSSKPEQPQLANRTESSIAETVNEVIAKHSAVKLLPGSDNSTASTSSPQPPQPKRRRNTRTTETVAESIATNEQQQQSGDGPTVKQHFQAQQNEKRKQEQQDKYLTKIREDMERHNVNFETVNMETAESFRVPGMTRTEFLQAHRQRKSENNSQEIVPKQYEKDTVVEIIEEIAGSSFPERSPEPPPYEFSSQQHFDNDSIQIIETDNYQRIQPSTTMQSFDELPDTNNAVVTQTKPKPKRIRKKPPPRETKVQKENKRKFLFKCLHLQRTIRSLILKNSALADETSRLFYRIKTVTEERKMLAKRVQHYERNRIRRIQSQKKKRAKAEAQLAQQQQQDSQEQNYPPSVEICEPETHQESVEAYPFENMTHKEMAVYLPPVNEDFGQIPYLDSSQYPFEDFHEPMNPNSEYSNVVYSMPSQFDEYSGHQNFQSFLPEMQEPPSKRQRLDVASFESQQYFNTAQPRNDNSHHSYFEQQHPQHHHQQQPISRSETPPTFRETPNASSSAS